MNSVDIFVIFLLITRQVKIVKGGANSQIEIYEFLVYFATHSI